MGVFGALNTAVSGLRAQGSALENRYAIKSSGGVGYFFISSNK